MIDLRGDGRVVIYKRQGSKKGIWHCRISVPNATGYHIVSTKHTDEQEARRFAVNEYEKVYFAAMGGASPTGKGYSQVVEEYIEDMQPSEQARYRLREFSAKYFKKKKIKDITDSDIADYYQWRIHERVTTSKNKVRPSIASMMREKTWLNPMFKYAKTKGHISEIPNLKPTPHRIKWVRRPTFTNAEWRRIEKAGPEWLKSARDDIHHRDRIYAYYYTLFMAATGLRVGEARTLTWADITVINDQDKKPSHLVIAVRKGKTGAREAVAQKEAATHLRRIHEQRSLEVDGEPDRDEVIFCHPDGKPVTSFKRSFTSLFKFAGVPVVKDGKNRTVYSLRHYYAVTRLSNGVDVFLLAKNMGTSVRMIEQTYGQVVTTDLAERLTKLE